MYIICAFKKDGQHRCHGNHYLSNRLPKHVLEACLTIMSVVFLDVVIGDSREPEGIIGNDIDVY